MRCRNCGTELDENSEYCFNCGCIFTDNSQDTVLLDEGQQFPNSNTVNPYTPQYRPQPMNTPAKQLDKKSFYKTYASKGTKGLVIASAVICFLNGAIEIVDLLVANLFPTTDVSTVGLILGNMIYIVEIAVLITFGVLLLNIKHWALSLVNTIHCGLCILINMALVGSVTGIVALIVGISTTINLKKVNSAFSLYKRTGRLPQKQI